MTCRHCALAGLMAMLAGCTLGPDYAPPAPPEHSGGIFVATSADVTSAEVPESWWRLYDDPLLDRLVAQALTANKDLQSAEANLVASRAILEGARAELLPQTAMKAGGVYGRDAATDEILELTGRKPQTTWIADALLDVSYELDLFGHVSRSIEVARDDSEAVAAERDALRVTVVAETTRAYAEICALGEEIAVARRSLDLVTRQQQIVQQRRDAGAASEFEAVRHRVLVAQLRAAIPPLEGRRQVARFELAALLGQPPAGAPGAVDACSAPPRLPGSLPIGDGSALLRRRPDIRAADRRYAASLAAVSVATADLFPRVSLTGSFGGISPRFNTLGSNDGLTWGVGPSVSWSFPDIAGPLARIDQTNATAAAAMSAFDSVVLRALKEVEQAIATYAAELDHRAALVEAQTQARQAFAQASYQYEGGAISSLDLLNSQQSLITADGAVATSDAAVARDQIGLFTALGGGWRAPSN